MVRPVRAAISAVLISLKPFTRKFPSFLVFFQIAHSSTYGVPNSITLYSPFEANVRPFNLRRFWGIKMAAPFSTTNGQGRFMRRRYISTSARVLLLQIITGIFLCRSVLRAELASLNSYVSLSISVPSRSVKTSNFLICIPSALSKIYLNSVQAIIEVSDFGFQASLF